MFKRAFQPAIRSKQRDETPDARNHSLSAQNRELPSIPVSASLGDPWNQHESDRSNGLRASAAPTVSSVYSQEDHSATRTNSYTIEAPSLSAGRASPPIVNRDQLVSSPDSALSQDSITDINNSKKSSFTSYIPTLRRSKSSLGRSQSRSPNGQPQLDRSANNSPQHPVSDTDKSHMSTFDKDDNRYKVSISGGRLDKPKKASWSERAAKLGREALALDTRPPWKGASGRTAIMTPVQDTNVPQNPRQYTAVKTVYKDGMPVHSDSDSSLQSHLPEQQQVKVTPQTNRRSWNHSIGGGISPIDPTEEMEDYGDMDVSPISTFAHPRKSKELSQPSIMVVPPRKSSTATVHRKPVGSIGPEKENRPPGLSERSQPASHFSWTTVGDSSADTSSIRTPVTPHSAQNERVPESASRFSWTTVNTSTTYQQDSPPPSPPPVPVPSIDYKAWRTPRSNGAAQDKPPTPPPHDPEIVDSVKSLPQPPAVRAASHIDSLNAQRDGLSVQRRNIEKIIRELKLVDQASPLEVDWKTRKANKKNLDEHQARLDEVEREDHEIGLALTRARRRMDREEGVDSGLWVRRVTG